MTNEELWQSALSEIEISISKANFITWFKNTSIISNKDGCVTIGVPNGFAKEWLENKYNIYILRAIRNFYPEIKKVSCVINNNSPEKEASEKQTTFIDAIIPQKKPFSQKINTSNPVVQKTQNNLNPRYTFEYFVVGSNNELARAACLAVTQNLGKIYNPLFIYGGVGLGKTHLIQSIGNELLKKDADRKIIYITSERFTSELIDSIKNQKIDEFKSFYQQIDLLIIDDIQFLSGKEKTQEEFFHIFNHLYQLEKQIVLSSDRPPKAIQTLEERLKSRFEGGMIADVSRPDFETRMAILRKKTAKENIQIEEKALEFIAENIKNNIRELEGALNRLIVSSQLTNKSLTYDYVLSLLSDLISSGKKRGVGFKSIISAVCDFYEIKPEDILTKNRKQNIVKPRQIIMYLMRTELNYSYPGIGEKIGGRDHTTAIHAFEKINKSLKENKIISEEINSIKEKLYSIY